jgi:hypothetical protein
VSRGLHAAFAGDASEEKDGEAAVSDRLRQDNPPCSRYPASPDKAGDRRLAVRTASNLHRSLQPPSYSVVSMTKRDVTAVSVCPGRY